jgi:hypothetical protein
MVEIYVIEVIDWVCKSDYYDECVWTPTTVGIKEVMIYDYNKGYINYKIKNEYQREVKEIIYNKCESKIYYWICPNNIINEISKYVVK